MGTEKTMAVSIDETRGPRRFDGDWDGAAERVSIGLRPIGTPIALGFFGLAAATFVLSSLQLGWVEPAEGRNVALALMGFAFLAQGTAAIFSFLARDGTAATAMGVLGLTWLVVGLVMLTSPAGSISDALGIFLLFSASAIALTGLTTMLSKVVPAVVFLVASVRFVLVAIYELDGGTAWKHAAGIAGLVLFALAMYAAWAAQLEDAVGKTVLPMGRHRKGKVARFGTLLEQVKDVPHEAGVSTQL
jgi:succinate-acetate transporter protein